MKVKYRITGIDCPNCAAKLAQIIGKKEGIDLVKINFLTEKITVESDMNEDILIALLKSTAKQFDKNIEIV